MPHDKIKIATWNINSIRVRIDMLIELVKKERIDVILLQETKCQDKDFPFAQIVSAGLNYKIIGQKSYNGVAILSKFPLETELANLPLYNLWDEDNESRYIECTFTFNNRFFRVSSIYVPNGQSTLNPGEKLEDSERFRYKVNFYKRLEQRIKELSSSLQDEYIIFAGDFNVAKEAEDLFNPKDNEGKVGFHPMERNSITKLETNLKDCFRILHPKDIAYTWWDYRTFAFKRNLGWRIDYILASPLVQKNLKKCYVDLNTRSLEKTSDHAPVIIEIAF
jgi:exodeoxyribonuclease-3